MNVRELIARLEQVAEALGDEAEIRGMHQANYPLQEVISKVWSPLLDGNAIHLEEFDCSGCGEHIIAPHDTWLDNAFYNEDDQEYNICRECTQGQKKANGPIAWIVLDGHPYEGSPYGDRRAWEN